MTRQLPIGTATATILMLLSMAGARLTLAQPVTAPDQDAVVGLWATEPNDADEWSHVEVYRCENRYCGRIVWLSHPVNREDGGWGAAGEPITDWNNPDEKLRNRPVQGLELMHSFRYTEDKWEDGRIYDPDSGKTYRCELSLAEDSSILKVRGYIKVAFVKVGRTTEWKRVRPDRTAE